MSRGRNHRSPVSAEAWPPAATEEIHEAVSLVMVSLTEHFQANSVPTLVAIVAMRAFLYVSEHPDAGPRGLQKKIEEFYVAEKARLDQQYKAAKR